MLSADEVTEIRVDDDGVFACSGSEVVLDVLFDGRRIWSFWLPRDGEPAGRGYLVRWPRVLRRFLNGVTTVGLVDHVRQQQVFESEVRLGEGTDRIAVVNDRGLPLGIDKSLRLAQTFDTRDAAHVEPLLDAIERVLAALAEAGVSAFPAYGTLLGAVREGALIGHDSDADLAYVSEHSHPVDVCRESFRLQRSLARAGYRTIRYSGAAFKVLVREADGSGRGLDVFGGFLLDGYLHLMGEIRTPFRREWVLPLGTTTLAGRELPAPAAPERLLAATYGEGWRVPDPAFHFQTPSSTSRRLDGWFRGTRVKRSLWDRTYSGPVRVPGDLEPSDFAHWVAGYEEDPAGRVVDVGCGRGVDALWFARRGASVTGLDYALKASGGVAGIAAEEGLDFELRALNLTELRSVLVGGARIARAPGPRTVHARHIADATDRVGRGHLWRLCEMMLGDGGRLYLQFLVRRGPRDRFAAQNHLRALPMRLVVEELRARGAHILHRSVQLEETSRRTGRLVVAWHG